ncbi:MAG: biotin/lipoyl-containing protein, partial [Pollutimonas bauzanensis]
LPKAQHEIELCGHAFEARIYAENPDKGFLPSIGTLTTLNFPPHAAFQNGDIRVDGGVRAGDTITPFYDPMIAKLIVRGADRDQARARMVQALGEIQAVGVQTNIAFLRRLMLDPAFAAADLDTGLIERQHDSLFPPAAPAPDSTLALAVAALLARQGLAQSAVRQNTVHVDPWAQADGWRINGRYRQVFGLLEQDELRELHISRAGERWTYTRNGQSLPFEWKTETLAARQYRVHVRLGNADASATVVLQQENVHVFAHGGVQELQVHDAVAHAQDDTSGHLGGLTAPMPGKIIAISVRAGDKVKSGDALLVMEAMKMEHTIHAPADGTVEELFFAVGDQVGDGAELIAIAS